MFKLKESKQDNEQKPRWWVKLTYPFGVLFYGVLLLIVFIMKLVMLIGYPIAELSGLMLGGGDPGWQKYKAIIIKLL